MWPVSFGWFCPSSLPHETKPRRKKGPTSWEVPTTNNAEPGVRRRGGRQPSNKQPGLLLAKARCGSRRAEPAQPAALCGRLDRGGSADEGRARLDCAASELGRQTTARQDAGTGWRRRRAATRERRHGWGERHGRGDGMRSERAEREAPCIPKRPSRSAAWLGGAGVFADSAGLLARARRRCGYGWLGSASSRAERNGTNLRQHRPIEVRQRLASRGARVADAWPATTRYRPAARCCRSERDERRQQARGWGESEVPKALMHERNNRDPRRSARGAHHIAAAPRRSCPRRAPAARAAAAGREARFKSKEGRGGQRRPCTEATRRDQTGRATTRARARTHRAERARDRERADDAILELRVPIRAHRVPVDDAEERARHGGLIDVELPLRQLVQMEHEARKCLQKREGRPDYGRAAEQRDDKGGGFVRRARWQTGTRRRHGDDHREATGGAGRARGADVRGRSDDAPWRPSRRARRPEDNGPVTWQYHRNARTDAPKLARARRTTAAFADSKRSRVSSTAAAHFGAGDSGGSGDAPLLVRRLLRWLPPVIERGTRALAGKASARRARNFIISMRISVSRLGDVGGDAIMESRLTAHGTMW